MHISMPPTLEATTYRAMYAFGNHLRVANDEEHLATRDNDIATMFEPKCVLGLNDQRPILAKLEYVN
jgi:hypothetical protein